MNQQNGQQKFIEQWNEIKKMKEEMAERERKVKEEMTIKKRKIDEEVLGKERKIMDEIMNEMMKKDEKNALLKKENLSLKMKMAKMKALLKGQNLSISWPARLPAELMNELFGSLPLENAFVLLDKMPNGILARNFLQMINSIKEAMTNNKLNGEDCGPKLNISEEGLAVKHLGNGYEINSVRANLPIPILNFRGKKSTIAFYYEMQITKKIMGNSCDIDMGFCTREFPLQGKWLGHEENSIGIDRKHMSIDGKITKIKSENYKDSRDGDVIGIGIIHLPNSSMLGFATRNGKLIGKFELASKFINLELFPAVTLYHGGEYIRVIFDKDKWLFKEIDHILE